MADGTSKPIEDVKLGDKVVATDPETGETSVETVTAEILGKGSKHLVEITIDATPGDGDAADAETVTATDGHPFWVEGPDEWTDATDLQRGDWLRTGAGTLVQVTAVARWTQQATVHNLTVTDLHTYYVLAGATPVLVHNCGEVAVDTNAVTDALSGAKTAEVDAALAGRAPVLSPTAHRELLEGGHSADAIGSWLSERGGRMGPASTSEGVASLQARLRGMWKGKSFNPMIADDDASVLHSAIQDGLSIITNDKRFYKNIERLGYSSERY
ncbi:hypothetical protein HOY81_15315 [Streptomyces sp. JJ36]|nr:hypothetical protein [Streptomyces sp. JJ36]